MNARIDALKTALQARKAVKVIAGIANFDLENVLDVVRAAEAGGAHAVDVAARPEIVEAVRKQATLAVFASSVTPAELAAAVEAGADVAELGNFDALYDQGLFLSAEAVLELARETIVLLAGRALVSVTVPGHLGCEAQVQLARELEALGVDLIQTEGAARVLSAEPAVKTLSPAEKEELTLRNTRVLVEATRLPVMTASGITAENAARAFETGAAAIGVGTYVKQASDVTAMTDRVQAVLSSRPVLVRQAS